MYFGFDPEFFLFKGKKAVPAHLGGFEPKTPGSGLQVFRDGAAVELNGSPNSCAAFAINGIYGNRQAAHARARMKGFHLKARSAVLMDPADMYDAPPDLFESGCNPSWNAYAPGKPNRPDLDLRTHPYRYAGGHFHFSYFANVKEASILDFVKLLDLFIGVPETFLLGNEGTFLRRRFYGRAGEYRFGPAANGHIRVEYRTPGPEVWNHVIFPSLFCQVARAVDYYFKDLRPQLTRDLEERVQRAINTGEGAEDLLMPIRRPYSPDSENLYTPELLKRIKKYMGLRRFVLKRKWPEAHAGFSEHIQLWKLQEGDPSKG